jgi:hypothetical protein
MILIMNNDLRILNAMFQLQGSGRPVDRTSLAVASGLQGRGLASAVVRLVRDGLVRPTLRVVDSANQLLFGEVRLTMSGLALAAAVVPCAVSGRSMRSTRRPRARYHPARALDRTPRRDAA